MFEESLFDVETPIALKVSVGKRRWNLIITEKHPSLLGRENEIKETLEAPVEIRRSKSDKNVLLFYRLQKPKRWFCGVVKRLNGEGFLITAYETSAIKIGDKIWSR